jgi:hypothetical protein
MSSPAAGAAFHVPDTASASSGRSPDGVSSSVSIGFERLRIVRDDLNVDGRDDSYEAVAFCGRSRLSKRVDRTVFDFGVRRFAVLAPKARSIPTSD